MLLKMIVFMIDLDRQTMTVRGISPKDARNMSRSIQNLLRHNPMSSRPLE